MNKSIGELRERGGVVEQYRVYRRGIITLPYLERGGCRTKTHQYEKDGAGS